MKTLLEKAKQLKSRGYRTGELTKEELDLISAYLKGEVNSNQIRIVLKKDGIQIYSYIVRGVRDLIKQGKLIFVLPKTK